MQDIFFLQHSSKDIQVIQEFRWSLIKLPIQCALQKEAESARHSERWGIQTIITAGRSIAMRLDRSSDNWLGLSDQPLQCLLPALPLQLCSHHLPALPVVLVHPVPLQDSKGRVKPLGHCLNSAQHTRHSWKCQTFKSIVYFHVAHIRLNCSYCSPRNVK